MSARGKDAVGNRFGCTLLASIAIGLFGLVNLAASNRFGRFFSSEGNLERAFVATVLLAAFATYLLWAKTGLLRHETREHASDQIAYMRERVGTELAAAAEEGRTPRTKDLWASLRQLQNALPNDAEVEKLAAILRDGESDAAADPSRRRVFEQLTFADVARAAFRERSRTATIAWVLIAAGVLVLAAACVAHAEAWALIAFAFLWLGFGLLMRRQSVIVSFGGSFLAAVMLTVMGLMLSGTSR